MSGIVVLSEPSEQSVKEPLLHALLTSMRWRGGDSLNVWSKQNVGLGVVQFWSTPEERGAIQPVHDETSRIHVVFDGRIDNRPELICRLKIAEPNTSPLSDASLALKAYEQWGKRFVEEIAGPFSTVVWNEYDQAILLARDPMGMRSLYYFMDHERFAAATSLHSLCAMSGVTSSINMSYLREYLCSSFGGVLTLDASPITSIKRLPAGSVLVKTRNTWSLEQYWKPWDYPVIRYRNDDQYAEHLRDLLGRVVDSQCRAVGPVGVTLSGGLDSSTVACLSKATTQRAPGSRSVSTYSLVWDQPTRGSTGFNEKAYIDVILDSCGGAANFIRCDDRLGFDEDTFAINALQDEPHLNFTAHWASLMERLHLDGGRVLLTGLGGDNLFSGNFLSAFSWARKGQLGQALNIVRAHMILQGTSYWTALIDCIVLGIVPGHIGERICHYLLPSHHRSNLNMRQLWITPDWLPWHSEQSLDGARFPRDFPVRFRSPHNQVEYEQSFEGNRDSSALYLDQYVGLRHGIDVRHPFLDRRVVDFAFSLPPDQKLRYDPAYDFPCTKYVLRRSMQALVPDRVLWRIDKTSYDFILYSTLQSKLPEIESLFCQSRAEQMGLIDAPRFLAALRRLSLGDDQYPQLSLMKTLAVELWLRQRESA